ncbi:MAG: hypothetical protein ABIJ72_04460 [bacterium]
MLVALALALLMPVAITPASAGWLTGVPEHLGADALPVVQLRLTPRFIDTLDPLVFQVASRVDEKGNPITISSAFFEENFTILKQNSPIMGVCNGKVLMGDGRLGEMYATYDGHTITRLVEPPKDWEDATTWLRETICQVRKDEGVSTMNPYFPPFLAISSEGNPVAKKDGSIKLQVPQRSVRIIIAAPLSNLLDGPSYFSVFVKQSERKRQDELFGQASAQFMIAHMSAMTVPRREIPRTEAPPATPLNDRVVSVESPLVDIDQPASTTRPIPPAVAQPVVQPYTPPAGKGMRYEDMPIQVARWFRLVDKLLDREWWEPCTFPAPRERRDRNCIILCFRSGERQIVEDGAFRLFFNGAPAPINPIRAIGDIVDGPQTWWDGSNRRGVCVAFAPPGARVRIEYIVRGGRPRIFEFDAGQAGWYTWQVPDLR